jgi:hypothetical protein
MSDDKKDSLSPPTPPPVSNIPYILAGVFIILIGAITFLVVLRLRPELDPLLLILGLSGMATTVGPAVFALLKTNETHTIVNSEFAKFKDALTALGKVEADLARKEGEKKGLDDERDRVEKRRLQLVLEHQVTVREIPAEPVRQQPREQPQEVKLVAPDVITTKDHRDPV